MPKETPTEIEVRVTEVTAIVTVTLESLRNWLEAMYSDWLLIKLDTPKTDLIDGFSFQETDDRYQPMKDDDDVVIPMKQVTTEMILKGVAVMAKDYEHQFRLLILEEGDAYTSDCLLQCVCLGEVIYC